MPNPFNPVFTYLSQLFTKTTREYAAAEKSAASTGGPPDVARAADKAAQEAKQAAAGATRSQNDDRVDEHTTRFLNEIMREVANPFGRPGQRIANRAGSYFFGNLAESLGLSFGRNRHAKAAEVSSVDTEIDDIVRNYDMPRVEEVAAVHAPHNLKNTAYPEAVTRAFVKVGMDSGLTLKEIKTLLEHQDTIPRTLNEHGFESPIAGGPLNRPLGFENLSEEAAAAFEKVKDNFTVGKIVAAMTDVDHANSKKARHERAQEEARNAPARQWNPAAVASIDSFLNKFSDWMGVKREGETDEQQAQRELTEATNKLTSAIEGQNTGTGTQAGNQHLSSRSKRIATRLAKRAGKILRPVARFMSRRIPKPVKNYLASRAKELAPHMARITGIPEATLTRAGAALGEFAIVAGAAALAISAVVAAVGAVYAALDKLGNWALQQTKELANYNPQLAYAQAMSEYRAEMRKFAMANAIAEGGILADGADRLHMEDMKDEEFAKLQRGLVGVGLDFGTIKDGVLWALMAYFNNIIGNTLMFQSKVLDWIDGPGKSAFTLKLEKLANNFINPAPPAKLWEGWEAVNGRGNPDRAAAAAAMNGPRPPMGALP